MCLESDSASVIVGVSNTNNKRSFAEVVRCHGKDSEFEQLKIELRSVSFQVEEIHFGDRKSENRGGGIVLLP